MKKVRFCIFLAGLPYREREDCAREFALRMMDANGCILEKQYGSCDRCRILLLTCAHNHVLNYARKIYNQSKNEQPLNGNAIKNEEGISTDPPDITEAPVSWLLRCEFWDRVCSFLEQLTPEQQEIMIRHHIDGVSIKDIASDMGRTEHAVEQALYAARHHLRKLMEQNGLTERELRSYLSSPPQYIAIHALQPQDEEE